MMTLFDMAYIVVMGYVAHAQTFAQLRSVNTDLYLTPKSFRQLGALLAVDILVNNGFVVDNLRGEITTFPLK